MDHEALSLKHHEAAVNHIHAKLLNGECWSCVIAEFLMEQVTKGHWSSKGRKTKIQEGNEVCPRYLCYISVEKR